MRRISARQSSTCEGMEFRETMSAGRHVLMFQVCNSKSQLMRCSGSNYRCQYLRLRHQAQHAVKGCISRCGVARLPDTILEQGQRLTVPFHEHANPGAAGAISFVLMQMHMTAKQIYKPRCKPQIKCGTNQGCGREMEILRCERKNGH